MSLTVIENQPIQFDVSDVACTCASLPFKQLVETSDITQVQFEVSPCLWDANVVVDSAFTDASNWTVTDSFSVDEANNLACKDSGGIGTISQYDVFITGNYYVLNIVVDSITETMQVWNGVQQLGNIDGVGEFTFAFQANGDSVSIRSFSSTNEACLASISAYELDSRLIVGIFDEDGTYQNAITLANDPDYFVFAKNTMTVSIDWTTLGISAGCYYIGIADSCLNINGQNGIPNQDMTDINSWTFPTMNSWPAVGYADSWGDTPIAGLGSGSQTVDLDLMEWQNVDVKLSSGISYDYTLTVTSNSIQTTFQVEMGTNVGVAHTCAVGGIAETFTGTILANGTTLTIKITSGNDSATYTVGVGFFDIVLNDLSDLVPDFTSVDLKLGTHDCSVLLNSNCNEDAMGFVFDGSRFSPRIRLEGELINSTYPSIRNTIEDTQGDTRILYGERKKAYQLILGLIPEYVLDYISTLPISDNIWVEGVRYFVQEDGFDIEYPDGTANSGRIVMNLIEQTAILVNTSVSGVVNDNHALDSDYVVDSRVNTTIIAEPQSGDRLLAL